jgi:hypothetical protein
LKGMDASSRSNALCLHGCGGVHTRGVLWVARCGRQGGTGYITGDSRGETNQSSCALMCSSQ